MNRNLRLVAVVGASAAAVFVLQPAKAPVVTALAPTGGAAIVGVALPAIFSQNAQTGKRGFDNNCAMCHGENAAGQNGVAPPLVHSTYRPKHHADEAIQRAVASGVRSHHWRFGDMPAVEGLTRADVSYIIAYIRELQQENGIN